MCSLPFGRELWPARGPKPGDRLPSRRGGLYPPAPAFFRGCLGSARLFVGAHVWRVALATPVRQVAGCALGLAGAIASCGCRSFPPQSWRLGSGGWETCGDGAELQLGHILRSAGRHKARNFGQTRHQFDQAVLMVEHLTTYVEPTLD